MKIIFYYKIKAVLEKNTSRPTIFFSLYSLLEYHKSKKRIMYCCFINFTKAFDNFWQIGLWLKLLKEGIHSKILNVIKNMYAEIKSCILLNGVKSEYFN